MKKNTKKVKKEEKIVLENCVYLMSLPKDKRMEVIKKMVAQN